MIWVDRNFASFFFKKIQIIFFINLDYFDVFILKIILNKKYFKKQFLLLF